MGAICDGAFLSSTGHCATQAHAETALVRLVREFCATADCPVFVETVAAFMTAVDLHWVSAGHDGARLVLALDSAVYTVALPATVCRVLKPLAVVIYLFVVTATVTLLAASTLDGVAAGDGWTLGASACHGAPRAVTVPASSPTPSTLAKPLTILVQGPLKEALIALGAALTLNRMLASHRWTRSLSANHSASRALTDVTLVFRIAEHLVVPTSDVFVQTVLTLPTALALDGMTTGHSPALSLTADNLSTPTLTHLTRIRLITERLLITVFHLVIEAPLTLWTTQALGGVTTGRWGANLGLTFHIALVALTILTRVSVIL